MVKLSKSKEYQRIESSDVFISVDVISASTMGEGERIGIFHSFGAYFQRARGWENGRRKEQGRKPHCVSRLNYN